jgi:pseudaminic acid biosynthesis-associated methylase
MSATKTTKQLDAWQTDFGRDYTERNPTSAEEMDATLEAYYGGVKKSGIFRKFLGPERFPSGKVLEVGCNVGAQLAILQSVNPGLELYGIEPQSFALERARKAHSQIDFRQGTAYALPFADDYFNVVMTNGVLIHIAPDDLPDALAEIHRTSKRYIFCHEYYSKDMREVSYKGHSALLWKMDYMQQYLRQFPELQTVDVQYLQYVDPEDGSPLTDQICLLEKKV